MGIADTTAEPDPRDEEIARLRAENEALRNPTPEVTPEEDNEDEYYLVLGNGERVKVKESEVPGYAGTNALHGFWTANGVVHTITDVVPAERKASK